jgi:hypothetical protein
MSCLTPIYSDCIVLTAGLRARLSALGYTSTTFEDLLVELIQKGGTSVSSQLADLKKVVEGIGTESLPAGARTFGLSSGSVDAAGIQDKSVQYGFQDGTLSYDLSAMKAGLPAGFSFVGASATVVDAQGKRSSIRGPIAQLTGITAPAQVEIRANVQTQNGLITLEKNLYISGNVENKATLTVRDLNEAPADLKQKEFNELIAAEVVALKQRL